jgi:hypothetical protein
MTSRRIRATRRARTTGDVRRDRFLALLVYPALLLLVIYPYEDRDWGWHYRYGEYLLTHGQILRRDIFSWTMPGYEWVNHSWLYDALLYLLFDHISFLGFSLAGALVGLLIFYLSTRRHELLYWQQAILAGIFASLMREALVQGLRTQVVGALLVALLMDFLGQLREGKTWACWALPCLFVLWVNLHGSFLLGLVIFAVFLGCDLVLLKIGSDASSRRWFMAAASFVISIALTLLNPFTYRVYGEAMRHFRNPLLGFVAEWIPPDFGGIAGVIFAAYTGLLAFGFYARRRLGDLPWGVVSVLTFYLALTAKRHVPVYLLVTLPFAASIVRTLPWRVDGRTRTRVVLAIMIATFGIAVGIRRKELDYAFRNSMSAYCGFTLQCSEGLADYLLQHPPVGRGLNYYDWGGYLIGRGVKAKLFVDGRMHLWERAGYQPIAEYHAVYFRGDWDRFEKYRFDWIVMPRRSDFSDQLAERRFPPDGLRGLEIWAPVYYDETTLYLVRKPPKP